MSVRIRVLNMIKSAIYSSLRFNFQGYAYYQPFVVSVSIIASEIIESEIIEI